MTDLHPTDDLDAALSALHADVPTDPERLGQTRAAFLDTVGRSTTGEPATTRGRFRRRWLVAAAAVLTLVTGGSLYATTLPGGSAEAKSALNEAAQHITGASDPVVPPGKYRYLVWHSWDSVATEAPGDVLTYLKESVIEVWIPADIRGTWYLRQSSTGKRKWLKGSDEQARKLGLPLNEPHSDTSTAKCGAFYGGGPCAANGGWQDPSLEWIEQLPKDPDALFARLKMDAPSNSRGETEYLVYAEDALRTGMLPAEVRAALYRALGNLKHLKITDHAVNLDGQVGVAYSSDDGDLRVEIVIDPDTGAYLGSREVASSGKLRGKVISYSSFSTAVAPAPWKTPR
ncbi:CU044_5270 family protein [Kribbella sp. NPDC048915]|uniref:CU044_5270 family protein n=1 Tax=Kribbella sp. NPDC048915 TaxID=3155148 RepID=UPI0033C5CC9A